MEFTNNKKLDIFGYQEELLSIYSYVKKIFEKYNIKLVAHSGTLLGIIRHDNDFIPWDDDLDFLVSYKDLEKNYKNIADEINSKEGKYWIFNFIEKESPINANIFMLRVYKRETVIVDFSSDFNNPYPFIDIMVMVPSDSFKTNIGWTRYSWRHQMYWMTRKGFDRYQGSYDNKKKRLWKNLQTYPLKLFFWSNREEKKIRKVIQENNGNWNVLRRTDPWTKRNIVYDMNKLIKRNIRGIEVYISHDYENELVISFGSDWNIAKQTHTHISSYKHNRHKRNIEIREFLDKLNEVKI